MKINNLTEKNFEQEISNGNCLVEFGAEWCGPCKKQLPVLEQLANKYSNIKFFKVDVDEVQSMKSKFQIRSVPTIILFKDGNVVHTKSGLSNLSSLETLINEKF